MDNEVAEARAKLAAKFGKVQLGGKGTCLNNDDLHMCHKAKHWHFLDFDR